MNPCKFALLSAICLALAGCDKLSSTGDQKTADAEAIGYACRVSQKPPEACMKENETFGPSAILDGWRSADKDIQDKVITVVGEPGASPATAEEKPAETAPPAEGAKPAEEKKKADKKPATGNKEIEKAVKDAAK